MHRSSNGVSGIASRVSPMSPMAPMRLEQLVGDEYAAEGVLCEIYVVDLA